MEHKWRVTNEAEESVVIITTSISNLPESFSLTEGKEMTDTVKIERIIEIDFGEEILARLKKEKLKIVQCKDCIHYRYYGLAEETVSECKIGHCENQHKDWFCADGERRDDDA